MSAKKKPRADRSQPPEHDILIRTGFLTPEQQTPPIMKCARCGEHGLTLIWKHPPVTDAQLADPKFVIPGAVWGEDVTCICPCCSFPGCPHRSERKLKVVP